MGGEPDRRRATRSPLALSKSRDVANATLHSVKRIF